MVRHCAIWYGMVWFSSTQGSRVRNSTLRYGIENIPSTVEFSAKLARFGLADVNFYALSVIQSALPPLKVGGEGLNLGVA
jgi:hypothetical protein